MFDLCIIMSDILATLREIAEYMKPKTTKTTSKKEETK